MKALVTGGNGFLGTKLCDRLRSQGITVLAPRSTEVNLRQPNALNTLNTHQFDYIFHLAAWTQAGDFCLRHPGEQWIINQQIHTNVLAWWNERQPGAKFISAGTSCVYDESLPHKEENYLSGRPTESLLTYAMTKRMLQTGVEAISHQFGRRYLTVVPSTLYGPGYHTDGRQMHFIFDLIRKILLSRDRGVKVELWGDGYQRRELVYIDDFTDDLFYLMDRVENNIVNIGAGEEYSIRHFAQEICEIVNFDFNQISFDTNRYVGAKSKVLNVDRLKSLHPKFKRIPLKKGLEYVIDWFEVNKIHLKKNC